VFNLYYVKKVGSILLLLGFGWFAFGYLMHTKLELRALKREMRSQLRAGSYNSEEIITITFQPDDFGKAADVPEKIDKHEIRWQGKMYDVVSASFADGKLVIRCIPDEQETQLLAKFFHFVKDKMGDKKKDSQQNQFSFWQFVNSSHFVFQPMLMHDAGQPAMPYRLGYSSFRPGVPVPPPWCVA
jgi:hypothetical protein